MKYIMTECSIEGCGKEFRTRAVGGNEECPACRSSYYYWKKRRPAQVLYRRGRLSLYSIRLDLWFNKEGRRK